MTLPFIGMSAVIITLMALIIFIVNRYKKCPSDKILVIWGAMLGRNNNSAK